MVAKIEPLSDENVGNVLEILSEDPLSNIVLIADCTQLRDWCDIRILRNNGMIDAIFSLYSDLDFLATAFWGRNTKFLVEIMADYSNQLVGKEFIAICTEEQLAQFSEACVILKPIKERQMIADKTTELYCKCKQTPKRLTIDHADGLRGLYQLSGTPAWTSNAMNLGPFYGIIEDDGTISAVAGVHYMTSYGTEIGNVATHPDHKRKGYAAACIKSVVDEVLKTSELIVLHYFEDNIAAKKLYEQMGFKYSEADPVFFVRGTCIG
ncbi:MAG: GNAT family N-acetyltransferase [Candidatus Thorarchaeota archaeon]|nr:MAG: GNAT family N-acetyltransferase [Candidatus Thorarchaeota archaeon]